MSQFIGKGAKRRYQSKQAATHRKKACLATALQQLKDISAQVKPVWEKIPLRIAAKS